MLVWCGGVSNGKTPGDAINNSVDAIASWKESQLSRGKPIPKSDLQKIYDRLQDACVICEPNERDLIMERVDEKVLSGIEIWSLSSWSCERRWLGFKQVEGESPVNVVVIEAS